MVDLSQVRVSDETYDNQSLVSLCSFSEYVQTMSAHFENSKNVTDRPPVRAKTAHFLPADFENGRILKKDL